MKKMTWESLVVSHPTKCVEILEPQDRSRGAIIEQEEISERKMMLVDQLTVEEAGILLCMRDAQLRDLRGKLLRR